MKNCNVGLPLAVYESNLTLPYEGILFLTVYAWPRWTNRRWQPKEEEVYQPADLIYSRKTLHEGLKTNKYTVIIYNTQNFQVNPRKNIKEQKFPYTIKVPHNQYITFAQ